MNKYAPYLLLLAALSPLRLHAQASTTFSSYVAADGGVRGGPTLVGGAIGAEAGRLGIRLGGTFDPRLSPPADAGGPTGFWSGEADALIYLKDPNGPMTVVPYLVGGIGIRSFRGEHAGPTAGTMSFGAGGRLPLFWGLAAEGEGRYRRPLASSPETVPEGISSGFEVRLGLSFRAGSRSRVDTRPAGRLAPVLPRSFPFASARPDDAEASARLAWARDALDTGDDFLGVKYAWGGNSPSSGFDCSGFIRYVYRRHGVDLPRVSRDQARAGVPLPLNLAALQPGDLMAFASRGSRIDHIAIYAGGGRILHSSSSGGGVRYDDLSTHRGSWYVNHWVAARRVIDGAALFSQ